MARDCGSTLLQLAPELQVKILLGLRLGELTRCTRVCKALKSLIAHEAAIQYRMELYRAGMVDGPSDVPLAAKLEKLRARNAAWETGFPLHTIMIPSPRRSTVRTCAGGFLLHEENLSASEGEDAAESNLVWKLRRPAWPELEVSGGLNDTSLLLTDWRKCLPEVSHIGACAVNPEEDMVVFTKSATARDTIPQCVVLSLSQDRTPHPLAAHSVLFASAHEWDTVMSIGDLIAWSLTGFGYSSPQGELQVTNWKTGAMVWHYGPRTAGKCFLLDPSHVLVVDHRGLFVYHFDPAASPAMRPEPATEDDCLLHLALPSLGENARVGFLRCHEHGPRYFRSDRPLFREDPDLNVLALYIGTFTHNVPEHLVFLIPLTTIPTRLGTLGHLPPEERQSSRCVPWDHWGPDGARLLKLGEEPHIITVMGSRVALPLRSRALLNAQDIYIVDVRPKSEEDSFGSGERDVSSAPGSPFRGVDASDTIQGLQSFAGPVTTRLPYRMTYIKAWSNTDSKFVEGQGLTHEGMVIMCSPMDRTIGELIAGE
ncbi:hypothetical protein C8T65DRAFT_739120 [Cerioporus squamosus]|nr:hypothetical protein C8T65DRAFT_739120 [Cerioporus squamosus]